MLERIFKIILLILGFESCTLKKINAENISIVNWNVQTFFDAEKSGNEYTEFLTNKNWTKEAYKTRLTRLCDCIKSINADIFVFEEIENEKVIQDIANFLVDFSWNGKDNWNYAAFAKNPLSAIGCAVLSKFPIDKCTVHNLDIRTENAKQPDMRPIMKVIVNTGEEKLYLFVNHWKSKSGSSESEIWRTWQENMLSNLIEKSISLDNDEIMILATGDFNQDIKEFSYNYGFYENIILSDKTCLYSPWFYYDDDLINPGSYYFNGSWERIDHFFSGKNLQILEFEPLEGPWCDENLIPLKYQLYNGKGYSDHLPIKCVICKK